MAEAAFWTGLFGLLTAIATGVLGILNHFFSTKPKIEKLEQSVAALQAAHADCEEHRKKMQIEFSTPWPDDSTMLVQTMQALARAGHPATFADAIQAVMHARKLAT